MVEKLLVDAVVAALRLVGPDRVEFVEAVNRDVRPVVSPSTKGCTSSKISFESEYSLCFLIARTIRSATYPTPSDSCSKTEAGIFS